MARIITKKALLQILRGLLQILSITTSYAVGPGPMARNPVAQRIEVSIQEASDMERPGFAWRARSSAEPVRLYVPAALAARYQTCNICLSTQVLQQTEKAHEKNDPIPFAAVRYCLQQRQ